MVPFPSPFDGETVIQFKSVVPASLRYVAVHDTLEVTATFSEIPSADTFSWDLSRVIFSTNSSLEQESNNMANDRRKVIKLVCFIY